jgi:hypothetical protein
LTAATADELLVHVIAVFNGLPAASLGVAVSCSVDPTSTFADDGLTLTAATTAEPGVTVMRELSLRPLLVATMYALPAAMPVTSPVDATFAIIVSRLSQLMGALAMTFPVASLATAASCPVAPAWIVSAAGVTSTVLTAGVVGVPDEPWHDPVPESAKSFPGTGTNVHV